MHLSPGPLRDERSLGRYILVPGEGLEGIEAWSVLVFPPTRMLYSVSLSFNCVALCLPSVLLVCFLTVGGECQFLFTVVGDEGTENEM